mgnify:CR=1 FL=1
MDGAHVRLQKSNAENITAMKLQRPTIFFLSTAMPLAHAADGVLLRAWDSWEYCAKFPTPETRADCESKRKESMSAFDKEQRAKQKAEKAADSLGNDSKGKDGLCFTRKSTGEVVCPN